MANTHPYPAVRDHIVRSMDIFNYVIVGGIFRNPDGIKDMSDRGTIPDVIGGEAKLNIRSYTTPANDVHVNYGPTASNEYPAGLFVPRNIVKITKRGTDATFLAEVKNELYADATILDALNEIGGILVTHVLGFEHFDEKWWHILK